MADQINEDDRATQELILRMIAQDLSAENQLQYSDSEGEESNEHGQEGQEDSGFDVDADATTGPGFERLHQGSNQTLSQRDDPSSPISVGTSVNVHMTDSLSFNPTGSQLPALQHHQQIDIPTTDYLRFDSGQDHPHRTRAPQGEGSGAIRAYAGTPSSNNNSPQELTDPSKETPATINKAQAESVDNLISPQQGLDTSSLWIPEDAQQRGRSTTDIHDWQSVNTNDHRFLEPAVEPPIFSTFEQLLGPNSTSWWPAPTSLATTSAMASSQNDRSQSLGWIPERSPTSMSSASSSADQNRGTGGGKRRMDDEMIRSQPSASNDRKRSKQRGSLSTSSAIPTHSGPSSSYAQQVAAGFAHLPVADQAYAVPVVSDGIPRAPRTGSHAYEGAAIPHRTSSVQHPQYRSNHNSPSAIRGNPFMGSNRATASYAAIPGAGRQSSNMSTIPSWPDYPPLLSSERKWVSPYEDLPEQADLVDQPPSGGREPPMDRPRRNIVQPPLFGREPFTGRPRRNAIHIQRPDDLGPPTPRTVNMSDYTGSDLTSISPGSREPGDPYDSVDSDDENHPQMLHEGVLYTRFAIPWPGKPGWVERDVDESFGQDYEEEYRGRRGRGGRHLSRNERMEMERRRREEATAVEICIGEDETLDSIIMEMVAKAGKDKKGKGKAAAQGAKGGLW